MHVTSYASSRAPYTGLREAFDALLRKRAAELSGGAFTRDTPTGVTTIDPDDRSCYAPPEPPMPLGMGFVQGVLAVLAGTVMTACRTADGRYGTLSVRGAGSSSTYLLDWDDTRPEQRFGGFVNGPTYHATIVGLVRCLAQADRMGSREVLERWAELVATLDALYPRAARSGAWDVNQFRAACHNTTRNAPVRRAIVRVAAALTAALRYQLSPPATPPIERALYVQYDSVLPHDVRLEPLDVAALLTVPFPLPAPAARERGDTTAEHDPDLDLDLPGDPADGDPAPSLAPSAAEPPAARPPTERRRSAATKRPRRERSNRPAPTPAPPPPPPVLPVRSDRVLRAVARPGHVFLFGVTATGKTTLAKHAAAQHGYGLELVVLKPGLKDELLYGTYVQTDRGWRWQDGPITRWARRAAAGERVALILDELARGPKDLVAGVMDLLNEYTAADVAAQRLPLPAAAGPYHLVRVVDTQETFVLPASMVKIIATANLGDRYGGLDLQDPAFRRRWTGGWLELDGYSEAEQRTILAYHLDLAPSSALITALLRVDQAVAAYQRKDEALVLSTNLALLIAWGQEVRRLLPASGGRLDPGVSTTFVAAAQDLWIDMVCPLRGDQRDPDVYRALLDIVQRNAPSAI